MHPSSMMSSANATTGSNLSLPCADSIANPRYKTSSSNLNQNCNLLNSSLPNLAAAAAAAAAAVAAATGSSSASTSSSSSSSSTSSSASNTTSSVSSSSAAATNSTAGSATSLYPLPGGPSVADTTNQLAQMMPNVSLMTSSGSMANESGLMLMPQSNQLVHQSLNSSSSTGNLNSWLSTSGEHARLVANPYLTGSVDGSVHPAMVITLNLTIHYPNTLFSYQTLNNSIRTEIPIIHRHPWHR